MKRWEMILPALLILTSECAQAIARRIRSMTGFW